MKINYLKFTDTAAVYRNEEDIGYVLNQLLNDYNLSRKDIFLTTKLCKFWKKKLFLTVI